MITNGGPRLSSKAANLIPLNTWTHISATYNSVSGNYEYQGGLNLPSTIAADREISLTYWTIFAVTESVQGNTINYTRYEYNGTDRGSVQIRLVF